MNITKPCMYHYLFTHIPGYECDRTQEIAEEIAGSFVETYQLHQSETFQAPRPDVESLSFYENERTETYLLQFRFHDTLITILTLNQTGSQANALEFWKKMLPVNIPARPDIFGCTTVLFAHARPEDGTVRQIAEGWGDKNSFRSMRFSWGSLYDIALNHRPSADLFMLLVPYVEELAFGDRFLSFSFPLLESFRQKVLYEIRQADLLHTERQQQEDAIRQNFSQVEALRKAEQPDFKQIRRCLSNLFDAHAIMQENIANTKNVLLTIKTNLTNLKTYRRALSIESDDLFAALLKPYRFRYKQFELSVQYTVNEMFGLNEQLHNLRHQYGTLPVRIWENELEELQFYLKRLKKALTRQDTSESLKAELQQILTPFEELFQEQTPGSTLAKARKVSEMLLNLCYQRLSPVAEPGKRRPGAEQKLKACMNQNLVPQNIYHSMNHIRIVGNLAVHSTRYAQRQTKEILSSLATVLEWYIHEKGL